MERFTIYVSGSSHNGSGSIGGSAFSVFSDPRGKICDGAFFNDRTTSNRAELLAICAAMKLVPDGSSVCIYTNNQYIHLSGNKWVLRWAKNGWKTKKLKGKKKTKHPVKEVAHRDLWQNIACYMETKNIKFLMREQHRCPEMLYVHQMSREQMLIGEKKDMAIAA